MLAPEQVAQPLAEYASEIIATSALYANSLDMVDGLLESLEDQAMIAQAIKILPTTELATAPGRWRGSGLLRWRAATPCPRWRAGPSRNGPTGAAPSV